MPMLNEIKKDGEIISLMDGSEYSVDPGDIPVCCTWIPTAKIKVKRINDGTIYNYKLTNKNIDVSVLAMKLG